MHETIKDSHAISHPTASLPDNLWIQSEQYGTSQDRHAHTLRYDDLHLRKTRSFTIESLSLFLIDTSSNRSSFRGLSLGLYWRYSKSVTDPVFELVSNGFLQHLRLREAPHKEEIMRVHEVLMIQYSSDVVFYGFASRFEQSHHQPGF